MCSEEGKIRIPQWLPKTAIIFFINLVLISAAYLGFENAYENRIYPGIFLGQLDLGGKAGTEAKDLINAKLDKITGEGFVFSYEKLNTTVYPIAESSFEGELAHELITFDADKTVENALAYGRKDGFFWNLKNKSFNLVARHRLPLVFSIDETRIKGELQKIFSIVEFPAKDAGLVYEADSDKKTISGKFKITGEEQGIGLNYENAIKELGKGLLALDNSPITLYSAKIYPKIYESDCLNIEKKANAFLSVAPLTLSYQDKKWTWEKKDLASLLKLDTNPSYASNPNADKIIISLDKEKIQTALKEKISPEINKRPNDAKFQMVNGRLAKFQTPSDGQELDIDATVAEIVAQYSDPDRKEIELTVKKLSSDISMDEVNNLGLTEIIGTGVSDFSGSPKNRIHNIKVGAAAVNGSLVKPGGEFSLISTLKALGDIGSSTGYLPELVIKEGRTIPEYGGGLCQIGTTVFRGALASGLSITQRRNHSYRVSYYEPAGTDATIYDPAPDFRFVNDTANHILIQSRFDGSKIYFDFWGTKDGRKIEQSKPTIYNIVKPAPTKITETLDLKPGEKKCTEKAHNGADAYFDYKVTYPDDTTKEKRFSSHYVPWQEICLLGVKELSTGSSTPIIGVESNITSSTAPSI